jgi:hypothetical protein
VSAEFDFLCLLVRSKRDLAQARQALGSGIDFDKLVELAAEHGVRPKLIERLSALSWPAVPASAQASLARFHRLHCARVLSLCRELRRLTCALANSGVSFALFKGPALAAALYGDATAREYNDFDIIVPHPHYEQAEQVLNRLGYHAAQGDRAFRRAFHAHLRQHPFVHPEIDAAIDLHWEFSGTHVPFPLAANEIWGELETVVIAGHPVPSIGGASLALLLAGHGTKEAWRCLEWTCDFALLVERRPELDWEDIHRRAGWRYCGDSVLLACAIARRLLGAPVPSVLAPLLARNARVERIVEALVDELRGKLASRDNENFSDLALCERRRDRIRAVLRLALSPTVGDYRAMPLPQALWPVYHATRPFRLAAKAVGSLRRPGE